MYAILSAPPPPTHIRTHARTHAQAKNTTDDQTTYAVPAVDSHSLCKQFANSVSVIARGSLVKPLLPPRHCKKHRQVTTLIVFGCVCYCCNEDCLIANSDPFPRGKLARIISKRRSRDTRHGVETSQIGVSVLAVAHISSSFEVSRWAQYLVTRIRRKTQQEFRVGLVLVTQIRR